MVLPTGEIRWLEARGKVDYAADGRPLRISGITLDITERKQAEELRQQEHRELETILAAIPAAVMITKDASCVEMIGNAAAYDLLERPYGVQSLRSRLPLDMLQQLSTSFKKDASWRQRICQFAKPPQVNARFPEKSWSFGSQMGGASSCLATPCRSSTARAMSAEPSPPSRTSRIRSARKPRCAKARSA